MRFYFYFVLLTMIIATTWASFDSNVIDGFKYLFQNRWGVATLGDTYFGFFTIYLWIAYKEATFLKQVFWLLFILSFGTIAISIYGLLEIRRLGRTFTVEDFLLRKSTH